MPKLVPIRGKELIRLLERKGFEQIRKRGSHARLVHPDGRKTTVPLHRGELIRKGLLRKILRDINLTPEEFDHLRRSKRK
ncbi:MAG: hypothetical protein A2785_01305 [Candidatus Chisholmbacteria bacterium RIFCSPHIGHO2_01_FULL_49_18]|uniref:Addiction module toxin, HicA family n=2 Tax=Candidatus Chisholmiibacteriota TaxID=1817900 RepID=A0A1G1VLG9_9BACT|nr:MAG: hypothetical protein A2785_01305 [Candidatus Chisholmbacteria bacterium RIFCSPHIGHO2_01_FULL_49_18]OGY21817.1 MAG: hypothetical protein A3A65_02515 [Candidatus Chisholmbacteria bacterium RIFCSPLOWO2_01_FULL_49_14]